MKSVHHYSTNERAEQRLITTHTQAMYTHGIILTSVADDDVLEQQGGHAASTGCAPRPLALLLSLFRPLCMAPLAAESPSGGLPFRTRPKNCNQIAYQRDRVECLVTPS